MRELWSLIFSPFLSWFGGKEEVQVEVHCKPFCGLSDWKKAEVCGRYVFRIVLVRSLGTRSGQSRPFE
jgi:hypothetical protein